LEELSLSEQKNVNGGVIPVAMLLAYCWSGFKLGFAAGALLGTYYYYGR